MREPSLLTVAEYLTLGETARGYDELIEGRVVMSPVPLADHSSALASTAFQL